MTDTEKGIGVALMRLVADLSAPLQRELLAFGQGMAAANALHQANAVRDAPEAVTAERVS